MALGEIDVDHTLLGNTEFYSIRKSLNSLINAIKKQIDLSLKISSGTYGETIELRSPLDLLNNSLNCMSLELKKFNEESNENRLLEKNSIEVNKSIIDSKDLNDFGTNLCNTLINQTKGCQATFYVIDFINNEKKLIKIGSYADDQLTPQTIQIGEGLVGEAAKTNKQTNKQTTLLEQFT